MQSRVFELARDLFVDSVAPSEYVHLDRVSSAYTALKRSIYKPLKMILLYGAPGTGKSLFLAKLHSELASKVPIKLYATPLLEPNELYRSIAKDLFGIDAFSTLSLAQFLDILELSFEHIPYVVVLLDEAQLYSKEQLEQIRLLADTHKIKFVIALHKTKHEELAAKEHFRTRIWKSIELVNANKQELKVYIQKKLMRADLFGVASMFEDRHIAYIHKLTKGNYRDSNKLLYALFELYRLYLNEDPSKITLGRLQKRLIEMAALQARLLG